MLIYILVLICSALLLLLVGKLWRVLEERSLAKADQIELGSTFDRWVESGRPEGERLAEFMKGRRNDLVVSNRYFTIGSATLKSQFAITQQKSGWLGTLFVTTNHVLIWLDDRGTANIVEPELKSTGQP